MPVGGVGKRPTRGAICREKRRGAFVEERRHKQSGREKMRGLRVAGYGPVRAPILGQGAIPKSWLSAKHGFIDLRAVVNRLIDSHI